MTEYDAGADYINWAAARETCAPARTRERRIIGEKAARWFVACGWIAGLVPGGLTALGAYLHLGGLNAHNFADALIILGLAYGTYRRSRICAGLGAIYYVANQVSRLRMPHAPSLRPGVVVTVAILATAYLLRVIGTLAYEAQRQTAAANRVS